MLEENTKAIELFCLIGLMPGGVTNECLDALWGNDWSDIIFDLINA